MQHHLLHPRVGHHQLDRLLDLAVGGDVVAEQAQRQMVIHQRAGDADDRELAVAVGVDHVVVGELVTADPLSRQQLGSAYAQVGQLHGRELGHGQLHVVVRVESVLRTVPEAAGLGDNQLVALALHWLSPPALDGVSGVSAFSWAPLLGVALEASTDLLS